MPKTMIGTEGKNLIGEKLKRLRKQKRLSQQALARELQLTGLDMDKNVITRIENNKRYVTDIELKSLTEVLQVSYQDLLT